MSDWIFMSCAGEPPSRFIGEHGAFFHWDCSIRNCGKWKNIASAMSGLDESGEFADGDYFWFPDPDFEFEQGLPNRLFDAMRENKLDVCQPAYTPDSLCSHPHLIQQPGNTAPRKVPHIEIGCPAFSFAALQRNFWTFDLNFSGYGIDFIWGKKEACFVLDSLTVRHPTSPDYASTARRCGLPDPARELQEIQRLYL